jgi:hypothetical protein
VLEIGNCPFDWAQKAIGLSTIIDETFRDRLSTVVKYFGAARSGEDLRMRAISKLACDAGC